MTSSFSPDLNPNKGQSRPYPRPVLNRRDLCRRKKQRRDRMSYWDYLSQATSVIPFIEPLLHP